MRTRDAVNRIAAPHDIVAAGSHGIDGARGGKRRAATPLLLPPRTFAAATGAEKQHERQRPRLSCCLPPPFAPHGPARFPPGRDVHLGLPGYTFHERHEPHRQKLFACHTISRSRDPYKFLLAPFT